MCFYLAKYTIDINGALESKLYTYMKNNKIKLRSVAIKKCIDDATSKEDNYAILFEIERKLNTILYRQNLNRKILEQLFCNMGFAINQDIKKDSQLQKIYDENNSRFKSVVN